MGKFDWISYGIECGVCFNTPPRITFLAGPIHLEWPSAIKNKTVPTRESKISGVKKKYNKKEAFNFLATEPLTVYGSRKVISLPILLMIRILSHNSKQLQESFSVE